MLAPGFVQALVTYAEVNGDAGLQDLRDQFNALFAMVTSGQGSAIISTASSGKSFGYQVNATAEELFAAFSEALRECDPDVTQKVPQTYAGFSCLDR